MNFLTSRLFRLARSEYASYFIGYAFEYASNMIPVRRLFEDRTVMAFLHPVPSWDIHYLIVPKRRIPTFASVDLTDRQEVDRVLQILQTAQALGRKAGLSDYTVLVNGGEYQDVPQLHFHVASQHQKNSEEKNSGAIYREKNIDPMAAVKDHRLGRAIAGRHPTPSREFHKLLTCDDYTPGFWATDFFNPDHRQTLTDLLRLAQELVQTHQLDRYTLLVNVHGVEPDSTLQLHLVSGNVVN